MKSIAVACLAIVCVIGLVAAQGYGSYYPQQSGGLGNGGLLALIGLLVLLMTLFGTSSSSGSGATTFIYGNFSGATGGK